MIDIKNIALVGSGSAASFFGNMFQDAGLKVTCILSRNQVTGAALASKLGTEFSQDNNDLLKADLILLCIKDDEIVNFVDQIPKSFNGIVAHCAGSVNIQSLGNHLHKAVIYPLQSLKGKTDKSTVPFLIEVSANEVTDSIKHVMEKCSVSYTWVNSEKRANYHLAAVFVNNFTNAIIGAAEKISINRELEMNLLFPLMNKTFYQVIEGGSAIQNQTGPALRNDQVTMASHLKQLEGDPELQKLYIAVSEYINSI
ncbi:MAG TPA: Rossmann-like and DUF2520 domain-containing protein [Bacteroidia bacterium]